MCEVYVPSSYRYAKQVIMQKVTDRRMGGNDDDNRHSAKFWLRPEHWNAHSGTFNHVIGHVILKFK